MAGLRKQKLTWLWYQGCPESIALLPLAVMLRAADGQAFHSTVELEVLSVLRV